MLKRWLADSSVLPGAPGVHRIATTFDTWLPLAQDVAASGGQLLALWAERHAGATVLAAFLCDDKAVVAELALADNQTNYTGLEQVFPCAARMQRAAADLSGVHANATDTRPWLRHSAWSADYLPLASRAAYSLPTTPPPADHYAFLRVSGDGVHEIPVGPVHAGIIEPGHFRFSIVGEKVLKLEQRLGYVHKGIEQLFAQMPLARGHRLAARVSGDSAVAYSWAYCQAVEGIARTSLPVRAVWLRALALESERIANHLGDLGALGNDAGFAFGLAQFSRLKELWLRALAATLGQRYLLDFVVPGGVARDATREGLDALAASAQNIAAEAALVRTIYDEHSGLRDRFVDAGTLKPELATRLGVIGLAGRASGRDHDLRVDLPCAPYAELGVQKQMRAEGDVAARVAVRFDELTESVRLVTAIIARLPSGECRAEVGLTPAGALGVGLVEGWRGPVMVALRAGSHDLVERCHCHDPSWQNWPALEHAIIGNIVPDFPLINKSFNLSYSGHDL